MDLFKIAKCITTQVSANNVSPSMHLLYSRTTRSSVCRLISIQIVSIIRELFSNQETQHVLNVQTTISSLLLPNPGQHVVVSMPYKGVRSTIKITPWTIPPSNVFSALMNFISKITPARLELSSKDVSLMILSKTNAPYVTPDTTWVHLNNNVSTFQLALLIVLSTHPNKTADNASQITSSSIIPVYQLRS